MLKRKRDEEKKFILFIFWLPALEENFSPFLKPTKEGV